MRRKRYTTIVAVFFRIVWFFCVGAALSYGTYLYSGSATSAAASDQGPLVIRDVIRRGEHHLSGIINVATSCSEITVTTHQVSPAIYSINFTTWNDPAITCAKEITPRPFSTILFAPSFGIRFIATLDDAAVPVTTYPVLPSVQL